MFTNMIGNSEKSISATSGPFVRLFGSSALARSMASFTRCLASTGVTSVVNSTVMIDASEIDWLTTFFTSAMDFSCVSIGRVIRFSTSVGDVPALMVDTRMVGITRSGNCSFGRRIYEITPITQMTAVIT